MFHWLIGSKCRFKRQQQQLSTIQLVSPPPLSEFEDKLFHWLIGVKCQNLRYLNLSLYFNLLCHFQIHSCSLSSTSCYCLATTFSSLTAAVISLPLQFPFAIFVIPTPLVYSHTTFLSAHPSPYFASQLFPPLHFANAVVKLLFPSMFFTLCLLTTQIRSLPPSHKL